MGKQVLRDGPEVEVAGPHHNGHAELRRLQGVVSAGGNQAAADKGDRGQRVDRRQLADGVEEHDLTWAEWLHRAGRLGTPIGALDPGDGGALKERSDCGEPLWMAGSQHQDELRIGLEKAWPGCKKRGFFPIERTAGNNETHAVRACPQQAGRLGLFGGAHIEFEVSGD